jgi:hypothetical protein
MPKFRAWFRRPVIAVVLVGGAFWLVTLLPIADPLPTPLQGWRTVGSYFDRPPPWPGKPWTHAGQSVDGYVLTAAAGPSHCGWDSATLLTVGWPVGTRAINGDQSRQYWRDPKGIVPATIERGAWKMNPPLPQDAKDTGYRYGSLKLFLAPSDQDTYAYLVAPQGSERWPRSEPQAACS